MNMWEKRGINVGECVHRTAVSISQFYVPYDTSSACIQIDWDIEITLVNES